MKVSIATKHFKEDELIPVFFGFGLFGAIVTLYWLIVIFAVDGENSRHVANALGVFIFFWSGITLLPKPIGILWRIVGVPLGFKRADVESD